MAGLMIPKYAIIANNITAEQREQIQGIVKANANGWWHSFRDLWIVGGRSAGEWRDLAGVAVPGAPGAVLVLAIDREDPNGWAYRGKLGESSAEWLRTDVHP